MDTTTNPRSDDSTFCKYMSDKYSNICQYSHADRFKRKYAYKYDRYKQHYVCFDCHYTAKLHNTTTGGDESNKPCPICTNAMLNVGLKFRAPKKHNTQQWVQVKKIYDDDNHAFTYSTPNCPYDDLLPRYN